MNDAGRIGFVIRGDYINADTYDFLDVVFYGGDSYVAKKLTIGNIPSRDSEYWQILAESGTLTSDSDISNTSVSFEESETRINVASGDKMSVFAGKVKKWFSDIKSAAFYKVVNSLEQTEEGQAVLDAAAGKWLNEHKLDKDNVVESVNITEPGFVMDGKTASDAFSELNKKLVYGSQININDDLNNLINGKYYCTNVTDIALSLKNKPPIDAGEIGIFWIPFTTNNRQGLQIAMSKSGPKAYIHIRIKDVTLWSDWNLIHSIA